MSQWGTTLTFKRDETYIKVTAHVKTDAFAPIGRGDIVDQLVLIDIDGDDTVAGSMFDDLKARFLGQPYTGWLQTRDRQLAIPL